MKKIKLSRLLIWILVALMFVCTGTFFYSIRLLNVLPDFIFYGFAVLFSFLAVILGVLLVGYSHTKKAVAALLALSMIITALFGCGDFYLFKTHSMFDIVSHETSQINQSVSIYVLNESNIQSEKDLEGKSVAILTNIDTAGTQKMLDYLEEKGISIQQESYSNMPLQVKELYDGNVDAILINDSYYTNIENIEEYRLFALESRQVASVGYTSTTTSEPLVVDNITTTPFTVLISGIDTYGDLSVLSRSDVNMLVTINPVTETILFTSLPRDTYTEIVCEPDADCINGEKDKLTHAGISGVNTSKKSIENLLGIDINYTFRVNFSSVIDIVNSLDGVDVYVEEGLAVPSFFTAEDLSVVEGWNHLDGATALAFARERYGYEEGDYQRIINQRILMKAMIDKAISSQILVSYASFMDALSSAFETNMTKDEMTTLIQYQLQAMPNWKFYEYSLECTGDDLYSPALGDIASVQVPLEESVKQAKENILAVMNGQEPNTQSVAEHDKTDEEITDSSSTSEDAAQEEQPQEEQTADAEQEPVYEEPVYDDSYTQDQTTWYNGYWQDDGSYFWSNGGWYDGYYEYWEIEPGVWQYTYYY
jgi:LCP family protein required for cell wall assembly